MEVEHREEEFKYGPPRKDGLESLMQLLAPAHGQDFLLFNTNGLEYIASGMAEAIPTGIPILVFSLQSSLNM